MTSTKHSDPHARAERLEAALREIERFGHHEGHGRGYTCANTAAEALRELGLPDAGSRTRIWIDTEFNGYKGRLISIALVAENGASWYEVLDHSDIVVDTWVGEHVIPHLIQQPISFEELQASMEDWLSQFRSVHLIADWPEDIQHFCETLITGPGTRIQTPTLTMEVRRDLDGAHSHLPHNALADALANREFMLAREGK